MMLKISFQQTMMKTNKQKNPLMVLVLVFLIIQVLISGYQLYSTINEDIRRAKLTQSVAEYTTGLDGLIYSTIG